MTNGTKPSFLARHIGPRDADVKAMLAALGVPSMETLITQAPSSIFRRR